MAVKSGKRPPLEGDEVVSAIISDINFHGGNLSVETEGEYIVLLGLKSIPDNLIEMVRLYKPEIIEYLGRRLI